MKRREILLLLCACAHSPAPIQAPPAQNEPRTVLPVEQVDRTQPPAPAPEPPFTAPRAQPFTLSNGLRVWLVERHDLPLVTFRMVVRGAGADADSPRQAGLAEITADLLDEGTKNRSALALADEVATLGANLDTDTDWDSAYVTMECLRRTLEQGVSLFAEVVTSPALSKKEFARVHADRLTEIQQQKMEARLVSGAVFARALYGDRHAYGHASIGREATLRAIGFHDVQRFYRQRYRPDRSVLIVVGDVYRATIEPLLERALGTWKTSQRPLSLASPPAPQPTRRFVIVDRPSAPQSEVRIGLATVPRTHPDQPALDVLNTVLGGTFSARLNHRLREQLGFTYGAYSRFDFRRGAGPFVAFGAIKTQHTAEAVEEFLRQTERLRTEPVPEDELKKAKQYLTRSLASRFEASSGTAGELADLASHDLPPDTIDRWVESVRSVHATDLQKLATSHLDPGRLVVVIVGDRASIEPELRKLGEPLELRDVEGRLLRP